MQRLPKRSEAGLDVGTGATVLSVGMTGSVPFGTIEWCACVAGAPQAVSEGAPVIVVGKSPCVHCAVARLGSEMLDGCWPVHAPPQTFVSSGASHVPPPHMSGAAGRTGANWRPALSLNSSMTLR